MKTFEIVRVADNVTFDGINEDEDFMPVSLWNQAACLINQTEDKEMFPTVE